jgi:murein DD-endopeptidase MepM/ murein hydrolase activator NlpD
VHETTSARAHQRLHVRSIVAATVAMVTLGVFTADAVLGQVETIVPPPPRVVSGSSRVAVKHTSQTTAKERTQQRARTQHARRHHDRHLSRKQRIGFTWPIRGRITSRYGPRVFRGVRQFHHGLDVACDMGDVLRASRAGRVIWAGRAPFYGNAVVVEHPRGWSSLYAHQWRILAWSGQHVARGQAIGLCGQSGRATGPHVHFEIRRRGRWHDPRPFLR